jgi:hypothetical protein
VGSIPTRFRHPDLDARARRSSLDAVAQQFVVVHRLPDLFRLQFVREPVGAQMNLPSLKTSRRSGRVPSDAGGGTAGPAAMP